MRSEKQIQASRINGAHSRGPVTAQGKRNSSGNNLRHGFSARDSSLDDNPPAAFLTLKAKYVAEVHPTTAEKRALDKAMARQNTNSAGPRGSESGVRRDLAFENASDCHALLRYQIAFDLQFKRALARLMALQDSRPASRIAKTPTQFEPRKSLNLKGLQAHRLGSKTTWSWVLSHAFQPMAAPNSSPASTTWILPNHAVPRNSNLNFPVAVRKIRLRVIVSI